MPYENLDKLDAKEKKSIKPPKETLAPSVLAENIEEEEDVPQPPAWEPYQEAGVLTPLERKRMDELSHFYDITAIVRIVTENSNEYVELFIKMLFSIHQTETLRYVLHLIENIFDNSPVFLREFHQIQLKLNNLNPYSPFLRLLSKTDLIILQKCYKCLASLFELDAELKRSEVENLLDNISNQLQSADNDSKKARMCVSALMILLKRDECREMFYKARGITPLINLLQTNMGNIQVLYEISFCLWLLSFNKNAETFFQNGKVIPRLHSVLKNTQKEKVIRVILATFKNLMNRSNKFISEMVNVSVPKTLSSLTKRNFEDSDIADDVKTLYEALDLHIDELSSFDEYRQEVLGGQLEWSPVHTSEKFWKENLAKLEQNNFYILRELVKLLDQSNSQNLAIACHDLGQFVQFHPRGKKILTDLNAKNKIIELMEWPDDTVKKHALLCTQKIMISNWQMIR